MGHPGSQGIDRRTVIGSAGVVGAVVVGAATVAACGGGDKGSPVGDSSAGSTGSGSAVIKIADIPVGGGKIFAAAKVVVTQPTSGEFKAFSATCTHKGCTVASVAGGTINCACHGSKFDLATGQVTSGPATSPLPSKTATVSDGSITVSS